MPPSHARISLYVGRMENIIEEWRPVVGYEGLYEVSNYGRVMSMVGRTAKERRLVKDNNGYLNVVLSKNGTCKGKKVHRLVAEAFLPNPNNLPQVNHKDEDKTNNAVWNLEWCSMAYNIHYGTGIQRRADKQKYLKMKTIKVFKYPNMEYLGTYQSITEAAKKYNCKPSGVSHVLHKKRYYNQTGGYYFEFA